MSTDRTLPHRGGEQEGCRVGANATLPLRHQPQTWLARSGQKWGSVKTNRTLAKAPVAYWMLPCSTQGKGSDRGTSPENVRGADPRNGGRRPQEPAGTNPSTGQVPPWFFFFFTSTSTVTRPRSVRLAVLPLVRDQLDVLSFGLSEDFALPFFCVFPSACTVFPMLHSPRPQHAAWFPPVAVARRHFLWSALRRITWVYPGPQASGTSPPLTSSEGSTSRWVCTVHLNRTFVYAVMATTFFAVLFSQWLLGAPVKCSCSWSSCATGRALHLSREQDR